MVLAEMRAARIGARFGRRADRSAHGDQALEVHPVVPGQIVAKVRARDADRARARRSQLARASRRRARGPARRAGCRRPPTCTRVERLADRLEVARGLADREARARARAASSAPRIGLAPRAVAARSTRAIASPAMPPNTVEFATPLPPRRLAPCTPPVSSPAAKRPSSAVRQSRRTPRRPSCSARWARPRRARRRGRSRSPRSARPCP